MCPVCGSKNRRCETLPIYLEGKYQGTGEIYICLNCNIHYLPESIGGRADINRNIARMFDESLQE
jgi:hypothetical protein